MVKWIIRICIITGLAILVVLGLRTIRKTKSDLYDAVPADASVIFSFQHYYSNLEVFQADSMWGVIRQFELGSTLFSQINILDSFFHKLDLKTHGVFQKKFLASLSKISSQKFSLLFIMESLPDLDQVLNQLENSQELKKTTRDLGGIAIVDFNYHGKSFSLTNLNGLILISFDSYLLESGINQLLDGKNWLHSDPSFIQARSYSSRSHEFQAFIPFSNIDNLTSIYLKPTISSTFGSFMRNLADALVLDFSLVNRSLYLSGYLVGKTERGLGLSTESGKLDDSITRLLPFNSGFFLQLESKKISNIIGPLNQDFQKFYQNWIGRDITFVMPEILDTGWEGKGTWIMPVADSTLFLNQILEYLNPDQDVPRELLIHQIQNSIVSLKDFPSPFSWFGKPQNQLYLSYFRGYAFFSAREQDLKQHVNRIHNNEVLAKDLEYLMFKEYTGSTNQVNFYFHTGFSKNLLEALIREDIYKESWSRLRLLNPISLQLSSYEGTNWLVNGIIQNKKDPIIRKTNMLWQLSLDAPAITPPFIVRNHYTREKEILIQDEKNQLYLVDRSGKTLWKKDLGEPIVGKIHSVDFYNNSKFQYLFSSLRKIHLIDRNGREVEQFPLNLPSRAVNGLSIVNYRDQDDYRMFIACQNGKLYGYYQTGKPLPGWNPRENLGVLQQPLRHLNIKGKDYLLALNQEGTLYLLNRKGTERLSPVKYAPGTPQLPGVLETRTSELSLINVDKSGAVIKSTASGLSTSDSIDMFIGGVRFYFENILEDERREIIIQDKQGIHVFDSNGEKRFEHKTTNKEILPFFIQIPGSSVKSLGYLVANENEIYLLDETGKIRPQYPVKGNQPPVLTDLLDDNRQTLITADAYGYLKVYNQGL